MNQEKIGNYIKTLRKDNNLTQEQLAKKLGVTYQAVSKWENGKNIPDLQIIKEICNLFNIDINELLDNERPNNKSNKIYYYLAGLILVVLLVFLIFVIRNQKTNFEFKTISTTCEDFSITGSAAYNKDKSSIYISNIEYCGKNPEKKYQKVECSFFERNQDTSKLISSCGDKEDITLEKFLRKLTINIDNYNSTCKKFNNESLYLEIKATDDENKITLYSIPLTLNSNC